MSKSPSRVPLEEVCNDIQTELWATKGLEQGVQTQTQETMSKIVEIAGSLPELASVALVPFGSRFKGYARHDSDLDLAIVHYYGEVSSLPATIALKEAIAHQKDTFVQSCSPHKTASAPRISLIDYGYVTRFSPQAWSLALAPACFEGERVLELSQDILKKWLEKSGVQLQLVGQAYGSLVIEPRVSYDGVAFRYSSITNTPEAANPDYAEIEASFQDAYQQRLSRFGGNILSKIEQRIT